MSDNYPIEDEEISDTAVNDLDSESAKALSDENPVETELSDSKDTTVSTEKNAPDSNGIRPYDPSTQRRAVRERLQSLEIINERFARQFRMGLFNIIRRSPDITVGSIVLQAYHEFAADLPTMTNLNLVNLYPLRGTSLFTFEPSLVYITVDSLFGGDGRFPMPKESREFTNTEQRIINKMLKLALDAYEEAWSTVFKISPEYVRTENQVKFTNITSSPNDIVVTTPFLVEIGNMVGEFSICLPFSMLDPIIERMINPPVENNKKNDHMWYGGLVNQVKYSELELIANFAEHPMRLSNVLKLKVGDVIPVEKPKHVVVHVDGVPVLTSKYGSLDGHYALRVEHLINPVLNTLTEEEKS